jgi:hypothetical protein
MLRVYLFVVSEPSSEGRLLVYITASSYGIPTFLSLCKVLRSLSGFPSFFALCLDFVLGKEEWIIPKMRKVEFQILPVKQDLPLVILKPCVACATVVLKMRLSFIPADARDRFGLYIKSASCSG